MPWTIEDLAVPERPARPLQPATLGLACWLLFLGMMLTLGATFAAAPAPASGPFVAPAPASEAASAPSSKPARPGWSPRTISEAGPLLGAVPTDPVPAFGRFLILLVLTSASSVFAFRRAAMRRRNPSRHWSSAVSPER